MPRRFVLLSFVLLAGCAAPGRGPGQVGYSALVLDQPVSVPEGRARAFLQGGALVGAINEFEPHCALEIRHVSGPPRTVPAGRYAITRVQDAATEVVFNAAGRRLAGLRFGIGIGVGNAGISHDGDSPPDLFEGYHFWLADSAGVGLMRLTCLGARALPVDVEPPTPAEMARALGAFGRLEAGP